LASLFRRMIGVWPIASRMLLHFMWACSLLLMREWEQSRVEKLAK
jgi:hypothetical protein